jgi:putative DNA primase/helicase
MSGRLDITFIRVGLAARAAELATALLGQPNRSMSSKRELRFGRRGSLAVAISGSKVGVWHDHEVGVGGDLLALILRERGGRLRDAVEFAEQFVGQVPREAPAVASPTQRPARHDDDDADRTRRALAIWNAAMPIVGTIAERYLEWRHVLEPALAFGADAMRFHPGCPFGEGTRHPCLLWLMRDVTTDKPRAIRRTALTDAALPMQQMSFAQFVRSGGKIPRMALGPKAGAAIKFDAISEVTHHLTIGEGPETVLSGMALGYVPAWAVGDAHELGAFPVLAGAESLTILVDNDKSGTGQGDALECSARWTEAGREVFRLVPRQPGADVNDLLRCQGGIP